MVYIPSLKIKSPILLSNTIELIQVNPIGKWEAPLLRVFDAGITPDIIGSLAITKHIPLNNDVVDLNICSDLFIDNTRYDREHIDCDMDIVGVNIVTREISPNYEYVLNKKIGPGELTYEGKSLTEDDILATYTSEKYGKTYYTLPPSGSEKIVSTGSILSYSGTVEVDSIQDVGSFIHLKEIYLDESGSNDIGTIVDCFLISKKDKSNKAITEFDAINVAVKDFNLKSGSEVSQVKSLTGLIKDNENIIDYFSDTFKPHFDETKEHFYVTHEVLASDLTNNLNLVSLMFDGVLFNNTLVATISAGDLELDFKPSSNKHFFKFIPCGVHKVGVREYYDPYTVEGTTNTDSVAISYETCYVNGVDFAQKGSFEHIYKNMIRPLYIKHQSIIKNNSGTITSNITQTILPSVAQVYNFPRDYIIKSIKPYFSFAGTTYTGKIGVYFGFLINDKITDSGIVHTEIVDYDDIVNGYELPLPIHVPRDTNFFVGFICGESEQTLSLKYIENGGYTANNYLISFPADIDSTMISGSTLYKNRMIKMDIEAYVYPTASTITIASDDNFLTVADQSTLQQSDQITVKSVPYNIDINRFMFFNNDIIPENSSVDYQFGRPYTVNVNVIGNGTNPTTGWSYFSILPNDEYVLSGNTSNYRFSYIVNSNDKYQSPILKPYEYNYILKKYEQTNRVIRSIPEPSDSGIYNVFADSERTFTGSIAKILLYNLVGVYASTSSESMNTLAKSYYGDSATEEAYPLIRLMFDFYQQTDENTMMNSMIPLELALINKNTGQRYKCVVTSFPYKKTNTINNPIGTTSTIEKKNDGWFKKTIEFIPMIKNESDNTFYNIESIEDWNVEITIALENSDNNFTLIRNISASVDIMHVDVSMPRFVNTPIFRQPPIEVAFNPVRFTAPEITQIVDPDLNI